MSLRSLVVLLLLACTLAACGDAPPTAGKPIDFAVACDKANDGQRVALTGYLMLPDSFTGDSSVVLWLYETDAFEGDPIGVQMSFGSDPNRLASVSDSYSDSDLKVFLAGGQTAGFGDKVTVSGKVYFPVVEQKFACSLENPLVELAE